MSHKGSKSRVTDRKAWDECPLWNKPKDKDKTSNESTKLKIIKPKKPRESGNRIQIVP